MRRLEDRVREVERLLRPKLEASGQALSFSINHYLRMTSDRTVAAVLHRRRGILNRPLAWGSPAEPCASFSKRLRHACTPRRYPEPARVRRVPVLFGG